MHRGDLKVPLPTQRAPVGSTQGQAKTQAEQVTSLGKDWHQPCLKCEKCGKTLTSGATLITKASPTTATPATPHGPAQRLWPGWS